MSVKRKQMGVSITVLTSSAATNAPAKKTTPWILTAKAVPVSTVLSQG